METVEIRWTVARTVTLPPDPQRTSGRPGERVPVAAVRETLSGGVHHDIADDSWGALPSEYTVTWLDSSRDTLAIIVPPEPEDDRDHGPRDPRPYLLGPDALSQLQTARSPSSPQ